MAVEGKQQRVAHGHGATKEDQLTAIATAVGSFRQPQADEDPGNGVDGVEQTHPKRLRPTSRLRNRLNVGACSAPATPIMKATSIKAAYTPFRRRPIVINQSMRKSL